MIQPLRLKCPACHDTLSPTERIRRCPHCSTAHHWDCFSFLQTCAIFGCPPPKDSPTMDDAWRIDPDDPVPIGDQITYRVLFAIARRVYHEGDKLPSVRELAARLKVNPNTVARALRDLERDGILRSRRGTGIFVHQGAFAAATERRQSLVLQRFERAVSEALDAGLSDDEIHEVLTLALSRAAAERRRERAPDTLPDSLSKSSNPPAQKDPAHDAPGPR